MQGLHLTADLHHCRCGPVLLEQAEPIAVLCRTQARNAGLTVVDERWHSFAPRGGRPAGVTGMLLLAESHLALHTWPEQGHVTLDVFVCNLNHDNSAKAEALMRALLAAYQPQQLQQHRLQRGVPHIAAGAVP